MADISKINAVLLANIAEIDDVLAANIAKVNGLVFSTAPAFTGLLDTYTGAAAAFSTRRLYGQYTGAALRVREDSGDTETDIGFDANGDLDTAAIATHCGTANGYVTKWYGQESSGGTGSGNDAAQTTSGSQPQIYNGSAVITDNGKPAIDFNSGQVLLPPSAIWDKDDFSSFLVGNAHASDDIFLSFSPDSVDWAIYVVQQKNTTTLSTRLWLNSAAADIASGSNSLNNQLLVSSVADVSLSDLQSFIDGTEITGTTIANGSVGTMAIGASNPSVSRGLDGTIQELVFFGDAKSTTDRSGIEGNLNAHFQIGNFGTPTSGLLYDYSGAAAAYSVRQLANTAALAMRIREDGTDTETDIGFDANGDLDTAAIASHCGTNNGYVVTWYDQSGNQVDATQGTSGSQPQIYNGSSVITENGKPAVEFDGTNDRLDAGDNGDTTGNLSIFGVGQTDLTGTHFGPLLAKSAAAGVPNRWSAGLRRSIYKDSTGTGPALDMTQDNTQQLASYIYLGGSSATIYQDGSQDVTASLSGSAGDNSYHLLVGGYGDSTGTGGVYQTHNGTIQEVVYYNADKSSDRSGIETNINGYFSIYT